MISSPKERPDLYDGYDFQDPKNGASEEYWSGMLPEHVKKRIAERNEKPQQGAE